MCGQRLLRERKRVKMSVFYSHMHWDHVQGLPFFIAGDRPDAQVDLYVPAQNGRTGRDLLAAAMAPPNFPITPEGLQGTWTFSALKFQADMGILLSFMFLVNAFGAILLLPALAAYLVGDRKAKGQPAAKSA